MNKTKAVILEISPIRLNYNLVFTLLYTMWLTKRGVGNYSVSLEVQKIKTEFYSWNIWDQIL